MKKRTVIFILSIVTVFFIVSISFPVSADAKIWGAGYKYHLLYKYKDELSDMLNKYNWVYMDGEYGSYYSSQDDENGLAIHIPATPDSVEENIAYRGHKLYYTIYFDYNNEKCKATFEGTRRFYDTYTWEMLPNDLFPINDDSVQTNDDLKFAD